MPPMTRRWSPQGFPSFPSLVGSNGTNRAHCASVKTSRSPVIATSRPAPPRAPVRAFRLAASSTSYQTGPSRDLRPSTPSDLRLGDGGALAGEVPAHRLEQVVQVERLEKQIAEAA